MPGIGRRGFLRSLAGVGYLGVLGIGGRTERRGPGRGRGEYVVGVESPGAFPSVEAALPAGARVIDRDPALSYLLVRVADAAPGPDVGDHPAVAYVESNAPVPVRGARARATAVTPVEDQPALRQVNAPDAWDALAEAGVDGEATIAVVDQGVDYDHPDLAPRFGEYRGRDVTGPSWTEDGDPAPEGDEYHGTIVAGAAAATRGGGVAGVAAPEGVRLLAYRASGDGIALPTDVAGAIRRATDDGADVINVSLGLPVHFDLMRAAVGYAVENGTLPVAAAGNARDLPGPLDGFFPRDAVWFPAAFEECVAVSAVDSRDDLAGFSRYGQGVDVTAPGVRVRSTAPDGEYGHYSGTSLACPVVAGVTALVRLRHPDLGVGELRRRVESSAVDVGLPDEKQGAGRVDALRAVTTSSSSQ